MNLPVPKPGLVIRYGFLWSSEKARGADEASKDRPCAIIVSTRTDRGDLRVTLAPITHSPPMNESWSLKIPSQICAAIGLDDGQHCVRLDELNRFIWPGFDLRPRPDQPQRYDYGMLPQAFYEQLRQKILRLQEQGGLRMVGRD